MFENNIMQKNMHFRVFCVITDKKNSLDAYDAREIVSRLELKVGEEMKVEMAADSPPPYTENQIEVPEPAEIDPWDILEETDDSPKRKGYFRISVECPNNLNSNFIKSIEQSIEQSLH